MKNHHIFITSLLLLVFAACRTDDLINEAEKEEEEYEIINTEDYSDWTDATHSKNATINYDIVFNQTEVLRFDIKISSSNWADMHSDLASILGSGGSQPGAANSSSDPMYVPCSFKFNDTEWYHVGIRYKGILV